MALINKKGKLKWISVYWGNPIKRNPTQINFPKLSIGFSFFGGWRFYITRGIDIKWMDANPYINKYGVHFTPDTKWCKIGQSYPTMGWGVWWHTKK